MAKKKVARLENPTRQQTRFSRKAGRVPLSVGTGKGAIIVTYDEDFADSRFYPLGHHHGIVRLRVWPTTIEQTQNAMERLITDLSPTHWYGCLIIIDNNKIRVRKVHNQLLP
jgi:hypothetical protein